VGLLGVILSLSVARSSSLDFVRSAAFITALVYTNYALSLGERRRTLAALPLLIAGLCFGLVHNWIEMKGDDAWAEAREGGGIMVNVYWFWGWGLGASGIEFRYA